MRTGQHSRTALAAAFYRAQHHLHAQPKLFDDPVAQHLLTRDEMAAFRAQRVRDALDSGLPPGDEDALVARAVRELSPAASVLVRARYAEDRLELAMARGVGQYVLVGAGLDAFAFRRAELAGRLQVFELDHAQSQALKRDRLAAAGLAIPPHLHFGTVDFEHESIADALRRVPFRTDRPAVFAWLGVTMYLTRDAITATWRALRTVAAPGSVLVFDFIQARRSGTPSESARRLLARTRAVGEPIIAALEPAALERELAATGWTLAELLGPEEIDRRYFATRSDGMRARPAGHLACVTVA